MFILIVFIKLRKIGLAKSAFEKVNEIFNVPPDIIAQKEYVWLVDILNFLKADEIQEFITFKELLSHNINEEITLQFKYMFISNFNHKLLLDFLSSGSNIFKNSSAL